MRRLTRRVLAVPDACRPRPSQAVIVGLCAGWSEPRRVRRLARRGRRFSLAVEHGHIGDARVLAVEQAVRGSQNVPTRDERARTET